MIQMPEQLSDHLLDERILIVDDDDDLSIIVLRRFEKEGYQRVDIVRSGEEALANIHQSLDEKDPYRLIILDLRLAGEISGKDVYHRLCHLQDIPVVIVSAISALEEIRAALKSCAVKEYFVKPVDLEILLLKSERILGDLIYEREIKRSYAHNQALFLNILQVMAKVLEARDPYTKYHGESVARHARQIAGEVGCSQEELDLIQIAGILHDFGKIGIRDGILNKESSLSAEEYEEVKRHPVIGSALLEPIEELSAVIKDIHHHHERWDGGGYPGGLAGDDIPLGARILCIADSYDAMTSNRAYRRKMPESAARAEIVRCKGMQFDPELVEVFLGILDTQQCRRERIAKLHSEL